ncbi:phosphomevalonate kinase [Bacillus sp. J14TS2]|uniref:phosphomevalonate kinase n=1 Tax=Bacillus sp. J14TS2 TaxID=2807188 RepID=UPI001B0EC6B5|nr:phosphomevalonate kinase [Bacillus sp. J14TS2]GIN72007.1 phosphomevalonate kinase [Bacillus sp. J14TS2]
MKKSDTIEVKVPGKLFVAGEYAVTEPGQSSIVIAIDRYITATIQKSDKNTISLPQWGMEKIAWEEEHKLLWESDPKFAYIRAAMLIWDRYLQEQNEASHPFTLTLTSELDDPSGRKYGLGSSAAVVVAVITALWTLNGFKLTPSSKRKIYKLAAIAHYQTQGNGSCADIAAATFGNWLAYSTFDSDWLLKQMKAGISTTALIAEVWPGLTIQEITPPLSLQICVGWTGNAAATGPMVRKVHQLKDKAPVYYQSFLQQSQKAVQRILTAFETNDCQKAIHSLKENRQVLLCLDQQAEVGIETAEIKTLIEAADKYGSGKSSGAGGGDCGIAFVEGGQAAEELRRKWQEKHIYPLPLQVSVVGAHVRIL